MHAWIRRHRVARLEEGFDCLVHDAARPHRQGGQLLEAMDLGIETTGQLASFLWRFDRELAQLSDRGSEIKAHLEAIDLLRLEAQLSARVRA